MRADDVKRLARTHVCGECGATLLTPWDAEAGAVVLRCSKDPKHEKLRRIPSKTEAWKRGDPTPIHIANKLEKKHGGNVTARTLARNEKRRKAVQDNDQALTVWQPFALMERIEDEEILREIQGEVAKALIYEFQQGGKKITGLSAAGAAWVTNEMAMRGEVIREIDLVPSITEEGATVIVKAGKYAIGKDGQEVLLQTVFGTKSQPRLMKVYERDRAGKVIYKDGQPSFRMETDPFFFEKACTKAARNAKRRLMSEPLILKLIELAQKKNLVRQVRGDVEGDYIDSTGRTLPDDPAPAAAEATTTPSRASTKAFCPIHGDDNGEAIPMTQNANTGKWEHPWLKGTCVQDNPKFF